MTATDRLTSDLKAQVLRLEDDLRGRVEADPELKARWQVEHRAALEAERSAASWQQFLDDRLVQSAVAWVLTSVFVRFCEDNALVSPVWIAGPPERRQEALDAQLAYFRQHPEDTDREWLMQAVDHLKRLPATAALMDDRSPLWQVAPSGQAVTKLLDFWRAKDDHGELIHDLRDETLSTRFLGDLYQDLSDHAKKTYALLQTPVFVEEFILDQTLVPALTERPLDGFRLIDPTCGSGHFLLGAFDRLVTQWQEHDHSLTNGEVVERALDSVYGVDINPFAVAIARFRLTVAALHRLGRRSLEDAPEWPVHVYTGDSLLFGRDQAALDGLLDPDNAATGFAYTTEDVDTLREVLRPGTYDVVVGNPPYITVKDKTLNQRYRDLYDTCSGKYALTVPFMERFFQLARPARHATAAGWTGQITSNSFMKREFGSKLIEDFLVKKDLHLVIDSDGAWIPGHNSDGTPTVVMVGRNAPPAGESVRAVLSKGKREPRSVGDHGGGPYWRRIVEHIGDSNFDDEWLTIADLDRSAFATHPWSLTGGGATDLGETIKTHSPEQLSQVASSIGITAFTLEDDVYVASHATFATRSTTEHLRTMVLGDGIRDWTCGEQPSALFPYDDDLKPIAPSNLSAKAQKWFWPFRANLSNSKMFGGMTKVASGLQWTEYGRLTASKLRTPMSITFAEVATHNHFVLDRGGKVFKQTAPVVKLSEGSSEDDHLALLGILNSSTSCFWLKQRCKAKGGAADHFWARTFQFNGSNVQDFPLPAVLPLARGRSLDRLAQRAAAQTPAAVAAEDAPTAAVLANARSAHAHLRGRMVAEQEELDWEVYRLYGLMEDDLTYGGDDLPDVALGERAFEIVLARKVAAGEAQSAWFERHGSTPVTEVPDRWPAAYRDLVQRRIDLIESDRSVALLEKPEHKRRWASVPWEKQQEQALRGWLLDRLEDRRYWFDNQERPAPRSIAQLADLVARDDEVMGVLALWEGRRDVPLTTSLTRLLVDEAVPYLAALRLKETGMRKRAAWEETWDLQRREDAGEQVGPIPVPPKYTSVDFRKASWWQARGKLDVPKERFILYPDAGRATDPTALLGWAGWDHAQQALALNIIIGERESEGAEDVQLVPLVAGLAELQPWVDQWHSDIDPTYGMPMAEFTREQLRDKSLQVGKTTEELAAWRPAPARRGRKARG